MLADQVGLSLSVDSRAVLQFIPTLSAAKGRDHWSGSAELTSCAAAPLIPRYARDKPRRVDSRAVKNVFIAAPMERAFIERLHADPQFQIVDRIEDAHVLITRTVNHVSREMLAKAPRLEVVAQGTSGIDNIDAEAAGRRGIPIVHLPGVNANEIGRAHV